MADERSRSMVARVALVLRAFDQEHDSLTVSELAAKTGLPIGTTHRIVGDLVAERLLDRDGTGYSIGTGLWEVGELSSVSLRFREIDPAVPALAVRGRPGRTCTSRSSTASRPCMSRAWWGRDPCRPFPGWAAGCRCTRLGWARLSWRSRTNPFSLSSSPGRWLLPRVTRSAPRPRCARSWRRSGPRGSAAPGRR